MRYRIVAVSLLLVLAGCTGQPGTDTSTPTPTVTDAADLPATTTTTTTTTTVPTSSERTTTARPTPTTVAPPENPWQSETVTVAVQHWNQSAVPAIYLAAVRNATQYWNAEYSEYSAFEDIRFEVAPNATDPDVVVNVVEEVDLCENTVDETFVGCADIHKPGDVVYGSSSVQIEAGYTPASTNETMRHEFGHLLGLEHGMEPLPLMAATSAKVKQSVPDATDRSNPWLSTNLSVAITGSPSETQREQIEHALAYIEGGADGLITEDRPEFTIVSDVDEADIVIEASRNSWACGDEYSGGSCNELYGYDEDADDALEYYSEATITLAATDGETTAWHVAYWLAVDFGATEDEIPEPVDGEDDDPRSEWWE